MDTSTPVNDQLWKEVKSVIDMVNDWMIPFLGMLEFELSLFAIQIGSSLSLQRGMLGVDLISVTGIDRYMIKMIVG